MAHELTIRTFYVNGVVRLVGWNVLIELDNDVRCKTLYFAEFGNFENSQYTIVGSRVKVKFDEIVELGIINKITYERIY